VFFSNECEKVADACGGLVAGRLACEELFVPECDHGIDAHRPPRRQISINHAGANQHDHRQDHCRGVTSVQLKQCHRPEQKHPLTFGTLENQVDDSLRQDQLLATLSGFFGGLGLLLALGQPQDEHQALKGR
jgi:hypothetical protein